MLRLCDGVNPQGVPRRTLKLCRSEMKHRINDHKQRFTTFILFFCFPEDLEMVVGHFG